MVSCSPLSIVHVNSRECSRRRRTRREKAVAGGGNGGGQW